MGVSVTFDGPSPGLLALDPYGFRWAQAALAQSQQASLPLAPKDCSAGAVLQRILLRELDVLADCETHFREVFGTPSSAAEVEVEQYARRDAGLPWLHPRLLSTPSSAPLVLVLCASVFPALAAAFPFSRWAITMSRVI